MSPQSRRLFALVLAICLAGVAGCSTTRGPSAQPASSPRPNDHDPLEPVNRVVFRFNEQVDKYALKPAAEAYRAVTPRFVRRGVANFFGNLNQPRIIANDLLQAKFTQAASDFGRFLFNTTAGLAGFIDVATPMDMPYHEEDFGQTLGIWGVGSGPYLVLPFLGPSNVRDTIGLAVDYPSWPPVYLKSANTQYALIGGRAVVVREGLLGASAILEQATTDRYTFLREAYRQRRYNMIHGAPAEPTPLNPELLEDDSSAPSAAPSGGAGSPAPAAP